ncbi:MAG: peptidase [Micrococcaceae bacterium]|nr:peptidase [Micrococcaceae bacterium]
MRSRFFLSRRILAVAGAAALMLLPAAAAQAEPPVTIPSGTNIVDNAKVLGSREGEVKDAIQKLLADHKYNLYVVTVQNFNGMTPADWGKQVATQKGMGRSDVLLAIATEGNYYLAANSASPIAAKTSAISQNAVVPNLAGGKKDYAQAAIDTAGAVGDAAGGGSGTVPDPTGGYVALGVGGVVVAGGVGTALLVRSRRRKAAQAATEAGYGPDGEQLDPMAGVSIPDLRTRAGSLLIAADDAIKSSEQEIGFAQAAYGDAAVAPFQKALTEAKSHLAESFKLQQQLDDHIPDTIEQQRSWYGEIIRRCEAANAALQEQKASFDALRELEVNAPRALASVSARVQDTTAKIGQAEQSLGMLQQRYADTAVATVRDNISQAQQRLDFVRTAEGTAQQKLAAADNGGAAVAVRAAEESLHQANLLLDAVGKVARDMDQASSSLNSALNDTENDLGQVKAMIAAGQNQQYAGQVAAVEALLRQTRQQISAGKLDPIRTLEQVEAAHSSLDGMLTGIRDQQQQSQRAQAALHQALSAAQAQISATQDYIAARRGGVGSEARTRIAEAQRNFDYALSLMNTDPVSALTYAQQATNLAQHAADLAQNDVDGFSMAGGGYGPGGYGRGGYGRGGGFGGGLGGGFGGAILGGILGGMLSGGGHSNWGGGGFGGWNSGGGGDFGGGGGGDFGGGDFGGGDFGGGDSGSF